MKQEYFFKNAKWIKAHSSDPSAFSVLRGHFSLSSTDKVILNVLGLGFFKCYINGVCVNPDTFLPLSSEYEGTKDPKGEALSGYRVYVPSFDISHLVRQGDNLIALQFGGGWYTHSLRRFGAPKAIFRIFNGIGESFVSDTGCLIGRGYVENYEFVKYEEQSYLDREELFAPELDDSHWRHAEISEPLRTEYCITDCPADKLIATLPVKEVGKGKLGRVYDCGQNTVGYPSLKVTAKKGERIDVYFSEELTADGNIDRAHAHGQRFSFVSDGKAVTVQPEFTWYGFRYFEVVGEAMPEGVKVVHADVDICSGFECDSEVLNWTYNTFNHTMLCNMHTGHPSDCPHIERRGYTGDGQLTCNAALYTLGAKAFYEKWLQDIADGQDKFSGHVQYTAPYVRSGGGPGGWGSAIVEVPYRLYTHFGDKAPLEKYYSNMRRYIDYLEAHSEFGLVTSDKDGEWCLGDWCGPNILYSDRDITSHNQQVFLPAPMVNTYFMVTSLEKMRKIAKVIGKDGDIAEYDEKIEYRKKAIRAAYFNTFDNNFVMNVQGANAYGVDIGIGSALTYENLVRYYKKLGCFDTGIFATDILTRILFERGDAELAVSLLTSEGEQGFAHWRQGGATTFHEYWDSNRSRSHNHHMFGAPVAYFFEYLLGIGQKEDTAGYSSVVIAPQAVSCFGYMKGFITTPNGKLAVEYKKTEEAVEFTVTIPEGTDAEFVYMDVRQNLSMGENVISVSL